MEIEWIGSPNYTEGRRGYKPISIFVHVEAGTDEGTKSWFSNPAAEVSAHYSIGRNGHIRQYVKEENAAWAVGLVNNPTWKYYQQNVNPNITTISVENEGFPEDGFTDVQIEANIWLIADIAKRWNIRVDLDTVQDHRHVCGHYQLDSVNRISCPGDKYPWDRVLKGVQAILGGNNEEDDEMLKEQVAQLEVQVKQLQDALQGSLNSEVPVWAKTQMDLAKQIGFLKGDGNGNMMPNAYTTRAQLVTLFDRAGYFNQYDQNVSAWAKDAVDKAIELGVIHGDGQGKVNPKQLVTKEQVAVMLNESGFFEWLEERKNKQEVKA